MQLFLSLENQKHLPSPSSDYFCCCRWRRQTRRQAGRQPVRLLAKVVLLLWESPHEVTIAADRWQPDLSSLSSLSKHIALSLNARRLSSSEEIIFAPGFYAVVIPFLPFFVSFSSIKLCNLEGFRRFFREGPPQEQFSVVELSWHAARWSTVDGIHLALLCPSLSLSVESLHPSALKGTKQGEGRRSGPRAGLPTPQDGATAPK